MVIGENMTTQNYLMVPEATNIVENICLWDGDPNTWNPPANTLMLVQATTPAFVWVLNESKTDYELVEQLGSAEIGFTWNGTAFTTDQPKPEVPVQPVASGIQEL